MLHGQRHCDVIFPETCLVTVNTVSAHMKTIILCACKIRVNKLNSFDLSDNETTMNYCFTITPHVSFSTLFL